MTPNSDIINHYSSTTVYYEIRCAERMFNMSIFLITILGWPQYGLYNYNSSCLVQFYSIHMRLSTEARMRLGYKLFLRKYRSFRYSRGVIHNSRKWIKKYLVKLTKYKKKKKLKPRLKYSNKVTSHFCSDFVRYLFLTHDYCFKALFLALLCLLFSFALSWNAVLSLVSVLLSVSSYMHLAIKKKKKKHHLLF